MGLVELFIKVLDMSITASFVIVMILFVRGMIRKFPKKYVFLLWIIVGIRLICPVFIPSPVSIFNMEPLKIMDFAKESKTEYSSVVGENIVSGENSGSGAVSDEKNKKQIPEQDNTEEIKNDNEVFISGLGIEKLEDTQLNVTGIHVAAVIWVSGIGIILLWNMCLLIQLKRKLRRAVLFHDNVYESDQIAAPFIMGLARPKIYIPFRLTKEEQRYILAHEQFHISRKDYITKFAAFMLTTIYWFHPLVWVAYFCMVSDMEMSCDEYVISSFGQKVKKEYSETLLAFAMNKRRISPTVPAFGETNTRKRVKNIMRFKKKRKYVGIIAIIVFLLVSVICLTDSEMAKKQENQTEDTSENLAGNNLDVVKEGEKIIFLSDVTGDGIEDKIVVYGNATDANTVGEGTDVISVISGSTGKILYNMDNTQISTVHPGFKSMYLYHGKDNDYLMIWNPEMYQGIANYQWKIIAINEQGEVNVLEKEEFAFDLNNPVESDAENLEQFVEKLNERLADSDLIISTLNGELVINDSGTRETQKYDAEEELKELESRIADKES